MKFGNGLLEAVTFFLSSPSNEARVFAYYYCREKHHITASPEYLFTCTNLSSFTMQMCRYLDKEQDKVKHKVAGDRASPHAQDSTAASIPGTLP